MQTAGPRSARDSGRRDRGFLCSLVTVLTAVMIFMIAVPEDILSPVGQKTGLQAMAEPNPLMRTMKLALLAVGLIIIALRSAAAQRLLAQVNRFFIAFLFLVPASYLWSISRPDTLARFISISSIVAIATAFCLAGWHPRRFQVVVRWVITALLAGSVVLYLTNPDLAVEHGDGTLKDAWHGLLSQKNAFGMISSMGVIFWLHAMLARDAGLIRGLAGVTLALTCLLHSRSSTSILATSLSCFLLLLCARPPRALRPYLPYLVGGLVVVVLVYALCLLRLLPGLGILLSPVTHLTGKDMTFSNRSEIWRIIKDHIQLSPLIGSGYGAYWIGPVPRSPSYTFLWQMWFYPTESHNGYLEITNDLGFVGLTVLFGYLLQFTRQALDVLVVNRTQGALFIALFFQQAILNLSESCWLEINSGPILPIMTLATMTLARTLLEQRQEARQAAGARTASPAVTSRHHPPFPGTHPAPTAPPPLRR
jgi:O-antigen ligase